MWIEGSAFTTIAIVSAGRQLHLDLVYFLPHVGLQLEPCVWRIEFDTGR